MAGFEEHRRPNESKLEPFRDEITEMRAKNWPLREIARWLLEQKQVRAGRETVRSFCKVRGIVKGKSQDRFRMSDSEEGTEENRQVQKGPSRLRQQERVRAALERAASEPDKKKFQIDPSKPLHLEADDD